MCPSSRFRGDEPGGRAALRSAFNGAFAPRVEFAGGNSEDAGVVQSAAVCACTFGRRRFGTVFSPNCAVAKMSKGVREYRSMVAPTTRRKRHGQATVWPATQPLKSRRLDPELSPCPAAEAGSDTQSTTPPALGAMGNAIHVPSAVDDNRWGFGGGLSDPKTRLTAKQTRYLQLCGETLMSKRDALWSAGYRPSSDRNADKMIARLDRRLGSHIIALRESALVRAGVRLDTIAKTIRDGLDSANASMRLRAAEIVGRYLGWGR